MPAPTMTNTPNGTNTMPNGISTSLKNGTRQRARQRLVADPHEACDRDAGDHELRTASRTLPENPLRRRFRDLQEIVIEADGAEAQRHEQHRPDIEIVKIGPQQRRYDDARQDHQPAHGRRALLLDDMALRPVGADRLAAALLDLEQRDDARPEQEDEEQRGQDRRAGARRRDSGTTLSGDDFAGRLVIR